MFYTLEPEVAGQHGEKTIQDNSVFPPLVTVLHHKFDGWLGNDLLELFPCFIISEHVLNEIFQYNFSGFNIKYDKLIISKSELFNDIYPAGKKLPDFYWFDITGKAGVDDFGISQENSLIVSERALMFLKKFNLDNCEIESWK